MLLLIIITVLQAQCAFAPKKKKKKGTTLQLPNTSSINAKLREKLLNVSVYTCNISKYTVTKIRVNIE